MMARQKAAPAVEEETEEKKDKGEEEGEEENWQKTQSKKSWRGRRMRAEPGQVSSYRLIVKLKCLRITSACKVCEMLAYCAVVADVTSKYKQDEEQRNTHEVLHGPIRLVMF